MLHFDYARTQELSAQPAGACLLVRRVDFEEIGGFEERFFYWFEDVDLVQRCGHGASLRTFTTRSLIMSEERALRV